MREPDDIWLPCLNTFDDAESGSCVTIKNGERLRRATEAVVERFPSVLVHHFLNQGEAQQGFVKWA